MTKNSNIIKPIAIIWIVVIVIFISLLLQLVYLPNPSYSQIPFLPNIENKSSDRYFNNNTNGGVDKFGIKEVYPTVTGGREWYVNMVTLLNEI